jgi:hypothetical protein
VENCVKMGKKKGNRGICQKKIEKEKKRKLKVKDIKKIHPEERVRYKR